MAMEFAGDKNTNEATRFRFACPDPECKGRGTFHAVWEDPPELVPSGLACPFGGDHDAQWIVDKLAVCHIPGTAGGETNPHYTTIGAASEHRWMQLQIEEARKAVNAEAQLTGTAASPYSKVTPNYEGQEKAGLVKRDDTKTSDQKQRIRKERAKLIADDASDKIDREIEQRHIGNRHDG